jgi:hypothetical protein
MNVLIVAKTHLSEGVCIGALAENGRYLRLMDEKGAHQPAGCPFEINQVWEITVRKAHTLKPPHVEDVKVLHKEFKRTLKAGRTMYEVLKKCRVKIWKGDPQILFDGCLYWTTSGSGYISRSGIIPLHSVGFWIPDKDLEQYRVPEKIRYRYPCPSGLISLPYVGFEYPAELIPAGTLLRVSLARWWDKEGEKEERCSLQLSGWYDLDVDYNSVQEPNEEYSRSPW